MRQIVVLPVVREWVVWFNLGTQHPIRNLYKSYSNMIYWMFIIPAAGQAPDAISGFLLWLDSKQPSFFLLLLVSHPKKQAAERWSSLTRTRAQVSLKFRALSLSRSFCTTWALPWQANQMHWAFLWLGKRLLETAVLCLWAFPSLNFALVATNCEPC